MVDGRFALLKLMTQSCATAVTPSSPRRNILGIMRTYHSRSGAIATAKASIQEILLHAAAFNLLRPPRNHSRSPFRLLPPLEVVDALHALPAQLLAVYAQVDALPSLASEHKTAGQIAATAAKAGGLWRRGRVSMFAERRINRRIQRPESIIEPRRGILYEPRFEHVQVKNHQHEGREIRG